MIIKCKMCGGTLGAVDGNSTCECEFCGTQQTIPTGDDDKKGNLFNRANRLRMNAEFDHAAAIYLSITNEFPEEAEAYWGLCLCRYGIEYVDDALTGKKIPTCHRTQSASILDDEDFIQACENADAVANRIYREEAKTIDQLQQNILSIVRKEEPYDVFICYKETDENGERTEDSVLAQEIYNSLVSKNLKVFFARITLEDKLGKQYEPYIYAALHSAKVMLAIGTSFDYYNAVWVKNEWARYMAIMKTDKTKALIPCYKYIDAYDMPREFKNLQAQDMSKLGWLQDLIRGIEKLCGKNELQRINAYSPAVPIGMPTVDTLLQRAFMHLEEKNWSDADRFLERILDMDPENPKAYIGKLLCAFKVSTCEQLYQKNEMIGKNAYYQKAIKYADGRPEYSALICQVKNINDSINLNAQLFSAIKQGDADQVSALLSKGANPNCERILEDGSRYSALRDSIAEWPNDAIACLLIEYGADVNYVEQNANGFKCPVLSNAIYKGNVAIVKHLLEKGANPNCERIFGDGSRYSALRDSVIQWPNDAIACLLIEYGADVNYVEQQANGLKCPVLISAICKGNIAIVKHLLEKGSNPNCERILEDGSRFSALRDSIAVWPNDAIACLLIEYGADVNYVEQKANGLKCPVLISAICEGNAAIVKYLLEKGANPNCERIFGNGSRYSALRDSVIQWPNDAIACLLIEYGADVNYVEQKANGFKCPVLISAIYKGNVAIVKHLLEKGANPNCERIFGNGSRYSALQDSIDEWPNDAIACLLIEYGADVNYVAQREDGFKYPVLISAIYKGNVAIVKHLLEKGANPNCERIFGNGNRYSALRDSVIEWPKYEIAYLLTKVGAKGEYRSTYSGRKVSILHELFTVHHKMDTKTKIKFVDILLDAGANFFEEDIRKMKINDRQDVPKEIIKKMKQAGWRPSLF